MRRLTLLALLLAASLKAETQITWKRLQLHGDFYSEGAGIGDINGDGKPDIVAGPFWWEGPAFEKKHAYYEPKIFSINGYSDNFFAYVHDFNGDQKNDILILGFPGKEARLYLNPGTHDDKPWAMHLVADVVDNESPVFTDITGDGKPEIVCSTGGKFGWFAPDWDKPTEKWPFVAVTDDLKVAKFTHGLGVGDVNGDGQMDLLEARRWWEQPASLEISDSRSQMADWLQHNFAAGIGGGAQMFAYDFDGNGTNDVFTSLAAHRYGVAVYLQGSAGTPARIEAAKNNEADKSVRAPLPNWTRVMLASEHPADNDYGIVFSQPHAANLADINGDGVMDIVTGKRYWAHNGHDPDEHGHRVIYWYETKRKVARESLAGGGALARDSRTTFDAASSVDFVPHLVDANSGVGVDVSVGDVNGDKLPDIVTANKAGVYVLLQERREISAAEAEQLRPKKLYGPALKPQKFYANGTSASEHAAPAASPKRGDGRGRMDIVISIRSDGAIVNDGKALPLEDLERKLKVVGSVSKDELLIIRAHHLAPRMVIDRVISICRDAGIQVSEAQPEAVSLMQLPGGFKADLIAAEPDIVQPIAMCWDERGRLWVIEGNSYPQPREVGAGKDRIKILEDKDGDGTFETVKVFAEGINLASGIEVGFGGVWVGAAPYLMFIPDKDRDDKPDKPDGGDGRSKTGDGGTARGPSAAPQVPGLNFTAYALLDGWGSQDTHETLNSFIWGPDGWLYGCHGVFTHSKVGKPGAPDDQRVPINAGVWRYHPVRHAFEVFGHGTSNPWGLDYDQNGEFFVTACVIPHLYHIVPGGRYQRQGGQHFNPYTYEDIKTIADHAHYAGSIRDNAHWGGRDAGATVQDDTNASGGGHAHCGLAIYQSSLFPQTYRNALIFGNLHGHRIVTDYLDVNKSTFTGKHGSDFLRSNDMHFIPVTQKVGPDGALYVSDWSDKQVCHRGSGAVELWDRSNGRIYRVSYGGWKPWKGDLAKESDESLAKLAVQTENEWESRMARRVLMERHVSPTEKLSHSLELSLAGVIQSNGSPSMKLRALWALRGVQSPNRMDVHLLRQVIEADASLAPAVIRLLGFVEPSPAGVHEFGDPHEAWMQLLKSLSEGPQLAPTIRELASLLQQVPQDKRSELAKALLLRGEVKDDPYIPLLIWYGIEPVVGADPKAALEFARVSKMPKVTEFIYRRMGAEEAGRTGLLTVAADTKSSTQREALLDTVLKSARAGNKIAMPENWAALRAELGASNAIAELEAFMGVAGAKQTFRARLKDTSLSREQREAALALLTSVRDADTAPLLLDIIRSDDKALTRRAVQGLATLPHPDTPALLVEKFKGFDASTQNDAVNTLATSAAGAKALLAAVQAKTVPATMLSPFLARQIDALKDAEVSASLKEVFGDLNAPKADIEQRKAKFRPLLRPADLAKADVAKGRMIYTAICGQCHKLFGEGQNVGPDLTGSNRANLDYVLDNVLDPNAVIGKDYQLNLFELSDGRVASGVVKEESAAAYRIAMPGGLEQTITASEVKKRTVAKVSTMPEGLFDALPQEQLQQLVAYLQSNAVPASGVQSPPKGGTAAPGAVEGETLKVIEIKGGKTKVQGMAGFGGKWSNGAQLWWTGGKPGDTLTLALPVEKAGTFALKAVLTKARDYGIIEVALDGKPVEAAKLDLFNAASVIITEELDWGTHELIPGDHKLTVKITGANPDAVKSFMFGLDYVRLAPVSRAPRS